MTGYFAVYEDNQGEYRWRLRDGNQEKIADSAEGYDTKYGCERAIANVKSEVPRAGVIDITD